MMKLVSHIRRVAVLGAGVMGAQIAAHVANAEIEVMLYDLPTSDGDSSAIARQSLAGLSRLDPAPLATAGRRALITPANYDQHLEALSGCDLVIEAIGERLDWKTGLYARIAPYIHSGAMLASNTSGLSLNELAKALPGHLRSRFCGLHFFNPPRYMRLVELIPHADTDFRVLDFLEAFVVSTLGKSVLRAKDTPNFIANRIGVFSLLATLHHTEAFDLGLDEVDALTGPAIGRPKSATYRTLDLVGLDTLAHVLQGTAAALPDDPWRAHFLLPDWLSVLIEQGALGQKSGRGVYAKQGRELTVLDPKTGSYRPVGRGIAASVAGMLTISDPGTRLAALRVSHEPQAQFLWAVLRDVFHYSAYWLADIADTARDADLALRWGFGWTLGPLETWQAAGWRQVAGWIGEDIAAGRALSTVSLPDWVSRIDKVHSSKGSYAPREGKYKPRSRLPVYERQLFSDTLYGEPPLTYGETAFEDDAVRLWHTGDDIAILSFKSKQHAIGDDVLNGIHQALDVAEQRFRALVLWQTEPPFTVGANLRQVLEVLEAGQHAALGGVVERFQRTARRLREIPIPVVAAVEGLALGGGCEFLLRCDRVVAALESYVGLVEAGVGLLPAGSGCAELARRADQAAQGGDVFPFIRRYFETVAQATVTKSAEEARQVGFLREADPIVFNPRELLHVAKAQALALSETGYRPPLPRPVRVAGRDAAATLKAQVVNLREGGFISAHDARIAGLIADVLCGGDLAPGTEVTEEWLLALERQAFMALLATPETQARIAHTLATGKPLRN